jgi:hypothetical protein
MQANTRVNLNGKRIFLQEIEAKSIMWRLFSKLVEPSEEFMMNDDGGKFKKQLSKFDISEDKVFGRFWNFKVNGESKILLKKVFEYYAEKLWGHWAWSLKGKDFIVEYQECGDPIQKDSYDPEGEESIYNDFKINAKGDPLKKIKEILEKYNPVNE